MGVYKGVGDIQNTANKISKEIEPTVKEISKEIEPTVKKISETMEHTAKEIGERTTDLKHKVGHKLANLKNNASSLHKGYDLKDDEESQNIIYLEQAIDDKAFDPSGTVLKFKNTIKKYKPSELKQLTTLISAKNAGLVTVIDKFTNAADPLTLTFLNKLIALSLPLIDRVKLYIFLGSLMPDL